MAQTAKLLYLDDLDLYKTEKPYQCTIAPWHIPGASDSNVSTSDHVVEINDMRPVLGGFALDVHGFEARNMVSGLSTQQLQHQDTVMRLYYRECETFLLQILGAHTARVFDMTVRTHH